MTFKPLEIQDCQNIAKAFERGMAYSVTEESVYAMIAPLLTGIRAQSSSVYKQLQLGDASSGQNTIRQKLLDSQGNQTVGPLGEGQSGLNFNNMDKADVDDQGITSEILGNFFPSVAPPEEYPNTPPGEGIEGGLPANIAGGLFNSECIPCGQRLNMLGELNPAKFLDMGKDYIMNWINWLTQQLQQLMQLTKIFTGAEEYIDLCALIKWMSDFICIPDLQRMLSVLMALMSRVSFELGGIIDIILGLIAPLLAPILSGFVDLLQSYILLIVRPIECIIDSLQDIIRKLDYNILFQNIDSLNKHVSIGSDIPVTASVKIPFLGSEIKYELPATGKAEADFNMLGPVADAIKRKNQEDQEAIENAAAELRAIKASSSNVDGSDPAAVERYNAQKAAAEDKYRRAIDQKTLSELGRINKTIDTTVFNLKSSLFTLIGFLREAAQTIEGFFQDVFDELKKVMGAYVGGGDSFIEQLFKKMSLVKMIAFISAIISAFANGLKCGEDDEDIKIEGFLPQEQGFKIWTDDEGAIHIEEEEKDFTSAIESMVAAAGQAASSLATTDSSKVDSKKQEDEGTRPESEDSRQRLRSLIEFTGDPVLDTQIARTTEALLNPVNVTFRCPLQTRVSQAEKVNKWIEELNSE